MTTAVPAAGTTPNRRTLVVLALVVLLIPAVLTALLVAGAARAEPKSGDAGTAERQQLLEPSVETTDSGKDTSGA